MLAMYNFGYNLIKKYGEFLQQLNPLSTKLYLSNLKTQFVPRSKHSALVLKTGKLMLYREIIAVCLRSTQNT